MANPYGMTEFDVTGGLNALEAARSNRIRQMLLQRQLAQEERASEHQRGISEAFRRYSGGGDAGAASASSAAPATLTPSSGAVPVMGNPAEVPAGAIPAPAMPPAAAQGDRQRLFSELLAIDPQVAMQTMQAFDAMDDSQFEAMTRRNGVLGRAAQFLLSLPEAERSSEFQRLAPMLMRDGGVTRQQLAEFELNENNLRSVVAQARDIEKLAEEARPDYFTVSGEVLDERRLERGEDPVVYRSEYIETPQGLARRPNAGVTGGGPRPGTIEDGYRFKGGDPANPNNWERVEGGAGLSSGSRPFP